MGLSYNVERGLNDYLLSDEITHKLLKRKQKSKERSNNYFLSNKTCNN